jgi:hypothetical protein
MINRNILLLVLLFTTFTFAAAQNQEIKATINEDSRILILESKSNAPLSEELKNLLKEKSNYRLYKISSDDPANPTSTVLPLDALLDERTPIICNAVCTLIFRNNVSVGQYVLAVNGLTTVAANRTNTVPLFFNLSPPSPPATATIVSSMEGERDKIRVQSKSTLTANPSLQVTNSTLKIAPNNAKVVPQTEIIGAQVENVSTPGQPTTTSTTGTEFNLLLDDGLSKAKTHNLTIQNGVVDARGNTVVPKGSVEIPGLPKKPDDLNFELKLSTQAAFRQKPFFDLSGKYNAQDQIPIGPCFLSVNNNFCYWHPQITVDLGLGNTKSANSIILDLSFRSIIYDKNQADVDLNDPVFRVDERAGELAIPAYYARKQTAWNKGAIFLFLGPKFESDRRFARINALGTTRLDFRMHRWLGSIREKRNLLTDNLTKEQAAQVEINSGFTIVPFIGVDFGRKVTSEVVENKKKNVRVVIPQHSIFRGFVGFNSTLELEIPKLKFPVNISLEERLFYLARQETIGSVIDSGVDLRKVNRFQNRSVLSFDLFFNQVRRYSFNVTYENGRKPPNFEYLNKVTAGFRVVY